MSKKPIKFAKFSSTVDSPFWVEYCHLKLETIQLSEEYVDVKAFISPLEKRLQLEGGNSLSTSPSLSRGDRIVSNGKLLGFNTLETFVNIDKNDLLRKAFLEDFLNEDESIVTSSLMSFLLLTFADLKQHKVLHWWGIPALMTKNPIVANVLGESNDVMLVKTLDESFHNFRKKDSTSSLPPFFVWNKEDPSTTLHPLSKRILEEQSWNAQNVIFGFCDFNRSTAGSQKNDLPTMGWPLRNLIAFLSIHLDLGGTDVTIVSFRPVRLPRVQDEFLETPDTSKLSILLNVSVPNKEDYLFEDQQYKVVGWEDNARGRPGPRWVNLRPLLDQRHLAIQAADLNLKLMKWRMIPNLNVDLLQSTKVLLIGAGTLGCSVARTLLGWGIRDFKILDYGNVSYSNPVRQNLFNLEDCHYNHGQGKPKAEAAAEALKEIAADVKAEGIHLSIPMPGHAESKESIETSVETLDKLIKEADAIFLLTDTRESRWLPTVMAASHDKPLINAALGLDSWLVMRHGGGRDTSQTGRLGCYFCNDVVAPENSTKNRTLDQQCTVTRPGLAPIASSMAVELMISLFHHSLKQKAPAPSQNRSTSFSPTVDKQEDTNSSSPLGVMPHQIRGSLVSYTMMTPTVPAFLHCTGCSLPTIDAYQNDKFELVYQACKSVDGSYLEELSGLASFRAQAAEKLADMEEADWDIEDEEGF